MPCFNRANGRVSHLIAQFSHLENGKCNAIMHCEWGMGNPLGPLEIAMEFSRALIRLHKQSSAANSSRGLVYTVKQIHILEC